MRENANVWAKVSGAERLSVSGPPALNGERAPYRDFVPFARARRRGISRPRDLGNRLAPSQSQGPHARRRTAGRHPAAYRADGRACSGRCSSTIRCGSTGPRKRECEPMALDKEFKEIPGTTVFDADQSRKGYWLNQFCMSLMKAENRARFKANERAYLDELEDDRGAKAGGARRATSTAASSSAETSTSCRRSARPTARASSRWPAR